MIARIDTPIAVEPIEEVTETVKDDIITPLKAR
jgi:hypothetical protein